jgi:hypothetical protein
MKSPSSMAIAITTMFAIVPKPGICFRGIQKSSTTVDTRKVDAPIFSGVLSDIPSASTVQGELPRFVIIKNASPIPKMVNPKIKIVSRCICNLLRPIDQVESARHGV